MTKSIILRFRDLVTEGGGTVKEHTRLINQFGEVWWGWWMRQYEASPRLLFQDLSSIIGQEGGLIGFLFDTGTSTLYLSHISKILIAPETSLINTPDPMKSPSYYHRGGYPAWFLLKSLNKVEFTDVRLIYDSFPTLTKSQNAPENLIGRNVESLEKLRNVDVTLWVVKADIAGLNK